MPEREPEALAVETGWTLALSEAGAWASAAEAAASGRWLAATVPGTAAAALEHHGLWDRRAPTPLHDKDIWYRTTLQGEGRHRLRFEGLATIAEIWLDDRLIATSDSMFAPLDVPVDLSGEHRLTLAFRSLHAALATRTGPRARWRTRIVEDARLRFMRTTLLGNVLGWCPPIHVVGPYRSVRLERDPVDVQMRTSMDGSDGLVHVVATLSERDTGAPPVLVCGATEVQLEPNEGGWTGTLRLADVALWWPHTHGHPALYGIKLRTASRAIELGSVGFRTISLDRGPDGKGFALLVNGVAIFCRGVCWTPDLVQLGCRREHYEPIMRRLASAHVNMLRVGGTMLYESPAFHALCDELGILVWQDAMLANFDYPRDEAFGAVIDAEVRTFLRRTAGSPSLAVLCGGSEVQQQAAMMGLPASGYAHPIFDTTLPNVVADERPDLIYVPGSPSGGTLPFMADGGPTHYYGVGAYNRPLEDARRAEVRFASECLTFANMPEDATLRRDHLDPSQDPAGWVARVPRDNGADWTFEDTRHHYMTRLYGVDCVSLREDDPQRYRDLSRAVTAEVTERTFDEWRRPGSPTAGGLVWFARDFAPGPGWGVIDSSGRPKSNFYALKRAFAPLRLCITDEGVNGLFVHCVNDSPEPVVGTIVLDCLRGGQTRVMTGRMPVTVPARGGISQPAFAIFGGFFDAGCAYNFGAPAHDTVLAVLQDGDEVLAETSWQLEHARGLQHDEAPTAVLERRDGVWTLTMTAVRALHHVVMDDDTMIPDDNGFFLAPGRTKRIVLRPAESDPDAAPQGRIRALNLQSAVLYG